MEFYSDWGSALNTAFAQLIERVAQYLPQLLGAVALLLLGWVVARLLRALAVRLARMLDHMLQRLSQHRGIQRPPMLHASADVLGSIVFWVVILFFLTAATHVLGLEIFSSWLNRVLTYLPTLLAGALIIIAGFLVSILMRDIVIATAATMDEAQRALLGRTVQFIILITAIVIGADQIGLNVNFLVMLAAILLFTVLGGMALAVSLGARTYVSNLIGGHALRQTYRVGQQLRIAGYEGKILELTLTALVLDTAEGRVSLPAKLFNERPSTLLIGHPAHDD